MINNTIIVTNDRHIPFVVRLVRPGDKYGLKGLLVAKGEPMVEFYDGRYNFSPHLGFVGQFVSRYYVATLLEDEERLACYGLDLQGGLCLDGGIPDEQLTADNVRKVLAWLKEEVPCQP